jgi:hypothetical protein
MVGKHIDVGRPLTYQSESLVASDKAVVMARVIGAWATCTQSGRPPTRQKETRERIQKLHTEPA